MRFFSALAAIVLLTACQPGDTGKYQSQPAPEPSEELRKTFSGCVWGEVKGADGLSIWSFACGPQFGNVKLAADDSLPGFVIESTGPEGLYRRPVVRVFRKAADAPIEAVLPALRAASPGPQIESCGFEATQATADGAASVMLTPVGPAKAAYDAAVSSDTVPPPPCGSLGVGEVGERLLRILPSDPESVVWIDFGSEIQIFDATTLKRERAH